MGKTWCFAWLAILLAAITFSAPLEAVKFQGIASQANSNVQSLVGLPGQEGSLLLPDGTFAVPKLRLRLFANGKPLAFHAQDHHLEAGRFPLVFLPIEIGELESKFEVFRAPVKGSPDVLALQVHNPSQQAQTVSLELEATSNLDSYTLQAHQVESTSGLVLQVPDTARLKVEVPALVLASSSLAQKSWYAQPAGTSPAFANIQVGEAGKPVLYVYRCKPGGRLPGLVGTC